MHILEKRSQRLGSNRALAGRKSTEHPDDTERLTVRQAEVLRRKWACSFELAMLLARLVYGSAA
jgi:hypothetical protein